jgi:hypothetical protein
MAPEKGTPNLGFDDLGGKETQIWDLMAPSKRTPNMKCNGPRERNFIH